MKQLMFSAIAAAVLLVSSQPVFADRWEPCARENQYCNVPGEKLVKYGADSRWTSKMVRHRIYCGNESFGDPAPGALKACYYKHVDTYAPNHGRHHDDRGYKPHDDRRDHRQYGPRWVRCSSEGGNCRFEGRKEVRYGAGDRWSQKSARHNIRCSNDVFGDPAPGVVKACYIRQD